MQGSWQADPPCYSLQIETPPADSSRVQPDQKGMQVAKESYIYAARLNEANHLRVTPKLQEYI
jgi:hypothetical protein